MTGRRVPFRQADVSRALKGARAAGFEFDSVEVMPDGRILIRSQKDSSDSAELDVEKWEAKYRAHQA
jgi:hypothetical protein